LLNQINTGPSPVPPNSSFNSLNNYSPSGMLSLYFFLFVYRADTLSASDLAMPAQPAGAGPSRIQLTPAVHPQTLSQILNDVPISTSSGQPPAQSPHTPSTSVFPFPYTRGGGCKSILRFGL